MSLITILTAALAAWTTTPEPAARTEPRLTPQRRGARISAEAVAASRPRMPPTDYAPARPPAGVVPDGHRPMAMDDGAYNSFAGGGYSSLGYGSWLGYSLLAELTQIPEYRLVSETIAKEMTRKWIKLQAAGDKDKSDKLKHINDELKRHKIQDKFRRLAELDGFFGRGHLFIDTGVVGDLLRIPLKMNKQVFKQGSLLDFRVVEPFWTYASNYNSTNPLATDFYHPTTWWVMAQEVHRSRLMTLVSRALPDMLKPAYAFGGVSMSQMIRESVENWRDVRPAVTKLIKSFSASVLKTDMSSILESGAGDELSKRANIFVNYRDNQGLFVIDRLEEFQNVSAPLGTLDHLQAQAQEHICSVSGIPLIILTGISPSGLNATSEFELEAWAQRIHSMQEHLFNDPLKVVLEAIQLDQFGEIDPDITFDFEPLKEASEEDLGKARKNDADVDAIYINAGVIGPDEMRQKLADQPDSPYAGIDLSAPAPTPPEMEADPLDGGGSEGESGGESDGDK